MTLTAQEERILKRFNEISLAAHMVELNVLKAKRSEEPEEQDKHLKLALEDIRMIHQDLTRFDYIFKKDDDGDAS